MNIYWNKIREVPWTESKENSSSRNERITHLMRLGGKYEKFQIKYERILKRKFPSIGYRQDNRR